MEPANLFLLIFWYRSCGPGGGDGVNDRAITWKNGLPKLELGLAVSTARFTLIWLLLRTLKNIPILQEWNILGTFPLYFTVDFHIVSWSEDSFKLTFTARHFVSKTRAFSRKGYEPNSPVFFALGFFVLTWTMEPGPSLCLLGTVAWA